MASSRIPIHGEPCNLCGTTRKYANGQCAECGLRHARKHIEQRDVSKMGPCQTCGGTVRHKHGACAACVKRRGAKYREKYRGRTDACTVCGATERYKSGNCRPCAIKSRKAIRVAPDKPCGKCGAQDRSPSGGCRPCQAVRRTEWRKANHDRQKAENLRRRAAVKGFRPTLAVEQISAIRVMQKGRCAICRTSLKRGEHVDHIIPIALGGSSEANNLQILCPPCNMAKGAKHPIDFARQRGMLL